MYTRPSIVDLLESVMVSLERDLAGAIQSGHAKAKLAMLQATLGFAIQRVQNELPLLVAEHNELTALHRQLATMLRENSADAAARVRQRGDELGGRADVSLPFTPQEIAAACHAMSEGLIATLDDLDELVRAGDKQADELLQAVRAYLGAQSVRGSQAISGAHHYWVPEDVFES